MVKLRFRAVILVFSLIFFAGAAPLWAANFLWRLEGPTGGAGYIVGSIHLARKELYPLAEPIMNAFGEARQLAVELDVEGIDEAELGAYVQKHGIRDDGRYLWERLSTETREALRKNGFSIAALGNLKPWLAAITMQVDIMEKYGYDDQYGLDSFFLRQAKARGLKIVELETLAEQMGPLAEMNDEEADLFFRATILELGELLNIMDTMFESWRTGDTGRFAAAFFQEYDKYPELVPILDKVVFRRNDTMAARIAKLLAEPGGTYFIVVGAGHLVGPGSILDILSKSGHRIEQL